MLRASEKYQTVLQQLLNGDISSAAFQNTFLALFKSETERLPDDIFLILDKLFADVDAYTTNVTLLRERPDIYLDDVELRARVAVAAKQLARLYGSNSETASK